MLDLRELSEEEIYESNGQDLEGYINQATSENVTAGGCRTANGMKP
jgi:hypothetical protein